MKKIIYFLSILFVFTLFIHCNEDEVEEVIVEMVSRYSTPEEFLDAMIAIDSIANVYEIMAFLDTLANGEPDPNGEFYPLSDFINEIIMKIELEKLLEATEMVYHFDGTPFSLISFIMKAHMLDAISMDVMLQIIAAIPLPPVAVALFQPPKKPKPNQPIPVCPCNPSIKILVTYGYEPPCGNYDKDKLSGYAANNQLNNMKTGIVFRLDAEVYGVTCDGTWTNTIKPIGVTSWGAVGNAKNPQTVNVVSYSSGTIEVTFTWKCACACGKQVSETFSLSF